MVTHFIMFPRETSIHLKMLIDNMHLIWEADIGTSEEELDEGAPPNVDDTGVGGVQHRVGHHLI